MRILFFLFVFSIHLQSSAVTAPNFAFENTQLSDLKGSVVYLDFWASWCKPCRKSFPWMNDMHRKHSKDGLVILAVNLDKDHKLAQQFLEKIPAQFLIKYDPEGSVAGKYKIPGMPTSYLIGRDGQLKIAHQGFYSDKEASYETEILKLLNEQE